MDDEPSSNSAMGWAASLLVLGMVLVAAVLGLPNFIKARATSSKAPCVANLKQIDGAVQQWALENKKMAADTYALSDTTLLAYLKGSALPVCPDGGRYLAGPTISSSPRCTIGGFHHTL